MIKWLPFLRGIFSVTPLTGIDWVAVVILGLMPLVISEIVKAFKRARKKAKA